MAALRAAGINVVESPASDGGDDGEGAPETWIDAERSPEEGRRDGETENAAHEEKTLNPDLTHSLE